MKWFVEASFGERGHFSIFPFFHFSIFLFFYILLLLFIKCGQLLIILLLFLFSFITFLIAWFVVDEVVDLSLLILLF